MDVPCGFVCLLHAVEQCGLLRLLGRCAPTRPTHALCHGLQCAVCHVGFPPNMPPSGSSSCVVVSVMHRYVSHHPPFQVGLCLAWCYETLSCYIDVASTQSAHGLLCAPTAFVQLT